MAVSNGYPKQIIQNLRRKIENKKQQKETQEHGKASLQHSKWIKNYTTHDTHGQKKSMQGKRVTWNPNPSQIKYGKKTQKIIQYD